MTAVKLLGHEPSFLPDGYEWQLAWHDEFDGTQLDMTKWDHRYCMMGKRHMTWQPEGVSLDGRSNCVFKIFEKDGMICSSQLQTGYNYMDEPNGDTATYGKTVWPIGKLKNPNTFTATVITNVVADSSKRTVGGVPFGFSRRSLVQVSILKCRVLKWILWKVFQQEE